LICRMRTAAIGGTADGGSMEAEAVRVVQSRAGCGNKTEARQQKPTDKTKPPGDHATQNPLR
jgi:hypothetical protein